MRLALTHAKSAVAMSPTFSDGDALAKASESLRRAAIVLSKATKPTASDSTKTQVPTSALVWALCTAVTMVRQLRPNPLGEGTLACILCSPSIDCAHVSKQHQDAKARGLGR
jgi:hypothetical protein